MTSIGDNIKKIRELRNFTQDYMAKELGMTQSGYSRIENGSSDITFSKITEIAAVLEVTPEDLVAFDSQKVFISINNVTDSNNNGSITISPSFEDIRKLFEGKIALQKKLIENYETTIAEYRESLERYRNKYGDA